MIRELLAAFGDDVRYVWRHLPLNDVHPNAQLAAEASEAAAAQGRFWEMHDAAARPPGRSAAEHTSPPTPRSSASTPSACVDELRRREYAPRVSEDVASADESGVSGTPPSSSTGAATTAPTTSPRSATRCAPRAAVPRHGVVLETPIPATIAPTRGSENLSI